MERLQLAVATLEDEGARLCAGSIEASGPQGWHCGDCGAALAKGRAAMLYTVVLPDRVHLLVTTHDGTEHIEVKIPAERLEEMISRFRNALEGGALDVREEGKALYDAVFAAAERALDAAGPMSAVVAGRPVALRADRGGVQWGALSDREAPVRRHDVGRARPDRGGWGFRSCRSTRWRLRKAAPVSPPWSTLRRKSTRSSARATRTTGYPGRVRKDAAFDRVGFGAALSSGMPVVHVGHPLPACRTATTPRRC